MKEKIAKLIDVKSIMTLALTVVFCVLAMLGTITGGEFLSIFTMIVGFYFGTQSMKKADGNTAAQTGVAVGTVEETPVRASVNVDRATYGQTHPSDAGVSRR